jgi:hypothetical protein
MFLAVVPVGVWSEAKTTRAPLAAKVTPWGEPLAGSPAALHPRLPKRAQALLQALSRPALANGHAIAKVCDDGLLPDLAQGYVVDSTGCGLPERLPDLFPGAGGRAAKAGAKMHAAWD